MRSTGGTDAPLGSTFKRCVLAATPSLKTLMEFPVWIVVRVMPAGALLLEPRVEARGGESVGALLALGRGDREMVGVLVLGVVAVAAHPAPLDGLACRRLNQLLPQPPVRPAPTLPPPTPLDPCR